MRITHPYLCALRTRTSGYTHTWLQIYNFFLTYANILGTKFDFYQKMVLFQKKNVHFCAIARQIRGKKPYKEGDKLSILGFTERRILKKDLKSHIYQLSAITFVIFAIKFLVDST